MSQLLTLLFALTVLKRTSVTAVPGLWDINIDKSPAPSPEDGPPASAGAIRDPADLKYELVAIFSSYLFWIVLTIIAIVIVRRRLSRVTAIQPPTSFKMDMLKLKPQVTTRQLSLDEEPLSPRYPDMTSMKSPKSPGKMASIRSWKKSHRSNVSNTTVDTVDTRVIDNDRARNMDEMTKLYAAVMAHDEERSMHQTSPSIGSDRSPVSQTLAQSPTSPYYPPEFQHLRNPAGPSSVEHARHPQMYASADHDPRYGPTPSSFVSGGSTRVDTADSTRSKSSQISVRGRPISRPIALADLHQSAAPDVPASPRIFNPGPPPPIPGSPRGLPASPRATQYFQTMSTSDKRQAPTPLHLKNEKGSSSNPLPFRQMYADAMRSAPPTKTTFLDRKAKDNGPRTGVPYSPYTPFTPMTPITPGRLPTKQELKQSRKGGLAVLREDGMVKSDEDMWGD